MKGPSNGNKDTAQRRTSQPGRHPRAADTRRLLTPDEHDSSAREALPDQIERIGRALTAVELSALLAVSRITIFKLARSGLHSVLPDRHLRPT